MDDLELISRRRFLVVAGAAVGLSVIGCPAGPPAEGPSTATPPTPSSPDRLLTRLRAPTKSASPGLNPLEFSSGRDGLFYVPRSLQTDRPAPLLVLLHGAGGSAGAFVGSWPEHAEAAGLVLAFPDSRDATWRQGGRDARFIDRMLATVSDRVPIDAQRIAVGGFSDGASYALLMGLTNGDVFKRIVAFSPGYLAASPPHGKPSLFVSHGTADTVLPIDRCSRVIVPLLRTAGYQVEYVEFDGGHRVLPEIRARAMEWLLKG